MTFEEIIKNLKSQKYSPVYFLQGDEPYYIDRISDYAEQYILSDMEKEFNQTVLYGRDVDVLTLLSYAKRFPMMSNHQVIIVKEAQELKNLFQKETKEDKTDPLLEYINNPLASTILVFCYKYKTLDKRTKVGKAMDKKAVVFTSKKIYDDKVPDWITQFVLSKGYRISIKATMLLAEYLGSDLSRLANEIEKLVLNVSAGEEITMKHVEENTGISKDFNVFELSTALAKKNVLRANQVANYFAANPRSNPLVLTLGQLYAYFTKILLYHGLADRSRAHAASVLGVNPYFTGEYETAAKAYPQPKVMSIISDLHEYDLKSKGMGSNAAEGELLKELVYRILH